MNGGVKLFSKLFRVFSPLFYCTGLIAIESIAFVRPSIGTNTSGIDWILVIDTSASMVGSGGTKNIFGEVQKTTVDFVNRMKVGDSVALFSFDRDSVLRGSLQISSNAEREALKLIVRQLQATGQKTHTGKAIRDALIYAALLDKRPNSRSRVTSIVLLTDGIEDTKGIPNPVSIPSNIKLLRERKCKPYLFFVSLGEKEHESQLDRLVADPASCGRAEVLRVPGASNLLQAGERIRSVAQASSIPPQKAARIEIVDAQTNISWEQGIPGETTARRVLRVRSNVSSKIAVQLESKDSQGISIIEPIQPISTSSNTITSVPLKLQVAKDASAGLRELQFALVPETKQPNTISQPTAFFGTLNVMPYINPNASLIDFGEVERGAITSPQSITITGNSKLIAIPSVITSDDISLPENLKSISVIPEKQLEVPLQLKLSDTVSKGTKDIRIDFVDSRDRRILTTIIARVRVIDHWWQRLLPFVLALIGAGGLAFWLWRRLNAPGNLEGELEVLGQEHKSIDLVKCRTRKIDLTLLVTQALGEGAVAELSGAKASLKSFRENGKDRILLIRYNGSVSINGVEVSAQDFIYDDDRLTLGSIQLILRAIDHPRPVDYIDV